MSATQLTLEEPLAAETAKLHRDPLPTALEAARRAAKLSPGARRRVLEAVVAAGPRGLSDHELVDQLAMNPSSVRPRRLELREAAYVEEAETTYLTPSGSRAQRWRSTPAGRWALLEAAEVTR